MSCCDGRIWDNCPMFSVGKCLAVKNGKECSYVYHTVCRYNFLCDDMECKYGHNISLKKRELITTIYYDNRYDEVDNNTLCNRHFQCNKKHCDLDHSLDFQYRVMIADILWAESDEKAVEIFDKTYNKELISNASTVKKTEIDIVHSSLRKEGTTFADLLQNQDSQVVDISIKTDIVEDVEPKKDTIEESESMQDDKKKDDIYVKIEKNELEMMREQLTLMNKQLDIYKEMTKKYIERIAELGKVH